jgi:hypothetical protein
MPDTSHHNQPDDANAEVRRRIAALIAPCPDCGHAMVSLSTGGCWPGECGCTTGKRATAVGAGRDTTEVPDA